MLDLHEPVEALVTKAQDEFGIAQVTLLRNGRTLDPCLTIDQEGFDDFDFICVVDKSRSRVLSLWDQYPHSKSGIDIRLQHQYHYYDLFTDIRELVLVLVTAAENLGFPRAKFKFLRNGVPLDPCLTLEQAGVRDFDVIIITGAFLWDIE